MSIRAEIKEIQLDVFCDECDSNEYVSMDYDRQDFKEALAEQMADGWLFKSCKDYRELFCFCSDDCLKDWSSKNKEEAQDLKLAELGKYSVEFTDDYVEVSL